MDEELERWAKAWRSMEVKHMSIMKRAQAAHRFEAMWQGVLAAVIGSGVLYVTLSSRRWLRSAGTRCWSPCCRWRTEAGRCGARGSRSP